MMLATIFGCLAADNPLRLTQGWIILSPLSCIQEDVPWRILLAMHDFSNDVPVCASQHLGYGLS